MRNKKAKALRRSLGDFANEREYTVTYEGTKRVQDGVQEDGSPSYIYYPVQTIALADGCGRRVYQQLKGMV